MTYTYWREVAKVYSDHNMGPDPWRYGQTCYNVLDMMYPELAQVIVGTDLDPFYLDNCPDHEPRWRAFHQFITDSL